MSRERPKNPAIPGTPKERTGAVAILRDALEEIGRRFAALLDDVMAIFDRIRAIEVRDEAADLVRTIYSLTPQEMEATSAALREALDRWVASGRDSASIFWWAPFDEQAAQLGTAQSVANLTNLSTSYAAARNLQQVIFSAPYRSRVAMAQIKSYDHWTGLAAEARSSLSAIITRAVVDGKSPRDVRAEIADALGVAQSKAAQYAQTDITDTLRQARWAESDYARETLGIKTTLLWTSALLPTTRITHAERNGRTYTSAEVRDFYSRDGNIYNCHCSQTECLLGDDGEPMLSDALKSTMTKAREAWLAAREERAP